MIIDYDWYKYVIINLIDQLLHSCKCTNHTLVIKFCTVGNSVSTIYRNNEKRNGIPGLCALQTIICIHLCTYVGIYVLCIYVCMYVCMYTAKIKITILLVSTVAWNSMSFNLVCQLS